MVGLSQAVGLLDAALQDRWPQRITFLIRKAEFAGHVPVVVDGVIEPLLAMGQPVTALIDHNRGRGRQIVEQAGGLPPGQPHQATEPFGCASLQQFFGGLIPQQSIQAFRHGVPQLVGNKRSESSRRQLQPLHRIERTLGGRVKFPEFVQLFPEEFQSHRQFTADRVDVDDVAAATPGSLLVDSGDPFISEAGQAFGQVVQVKLIALFQGATGGFKRGPWRQVGLKAAFRGHDRLRRRIFTTDQLTQNLELSPDDFAGGVKGFVGGSLTGGIQAGAAPPHQFQQSCPATGFFKGGHHHQQRSLVPLCKGTGEKCTADPTGAAQEQTLITLAALEQFASEGCITQLGHQGTQGHGADRSAIADLRNRVRPTASRPCRAFDVQPVAVVRPLF